MEFKGDIAYFLSNTIVATDGCPLHEAFMAKI